MGPKDLAQVLRFLPPTLKNADVIVGLDTPDDAGVIRISPELALVQTMDFFTPIVDDPYQFGQIAAANSLSDVYAMGGKPLTAMNVVGFPVGKLPMSMLADILRGGADKVAESGATLIGGHSIDDPEPKYGLSVTGTVHPDRVVKKAGARPGDKLVLSKPIGVGVITTAIKKEAVPAAVLDETVAVMAKLNDQVDALHEFDVRGGTDITGFGLLGHAHEIARESKVALRIRRQDVPIIEGARPLAERGFVPGGSRNNLLWLGDKVVYDDSIDEVDRILLCDAVTSGGLLLSVAPGSSAPLRRRLVELGAIMAVEIGEVVEGQPGRIEVTR